VKPMRRLWRGRKQGRSEGKETQFKRARIMLGYTQEQMASRLGCSPNYLSQVELGEREPYEIYRNRLFAMIMRYSLKLGNLNSLDEF